MPPTAAVWTVLQPNLRILSGTLRLLPRWARKWFRRCSARQRKTKQITVISFDLESRQAQRFLGYEALPWFNSENIFMIMVQKSRHLLWSLNSSDILQKFEFPFKPMWPNRPEQMSSCGRSYRNCYVQTDRIGTIWMPIAWQWKPVLYW